MSESIDWPNLKLPPINLYNAPKIEVKPSVITPNLKNALDQVASQKIIPNTTQ